VEIAVAFIIGVSFATVVTTLTAVILFLIAKATGGRNPDMTSSRPGGIPVGPFLTASMS
jgi:large conductance mechanosensitive channel